MCGIVGYIGPSPASDVLLAGLRRLEYRGYDSAGLAVVDEEGLEVRRSVGRVQGLATHLRASPVHGSIGIAHTRWATHGRPSERNAHPHLDASRQFALVHNGVIENYAAIRRALTGEGIEFQSETDTEVLVQLIGFLHARSGDVLGSVREALSEVRGSFGIALLSPLLPDQLIVAKRGSPIVIGLGEGEAIIGSDVSAVIAHTNRVTYLADNEVACVSRHGVQAWQIDATPVSKEFEAVDLVIDDLTTGDCPHYMLKEIRQQPDTLRDALRGRIDSRAGRVVLGGLQKLSERISCLRHVLLFGCGTAWHAALIGGYMIEQLSGLPIHVEYASELRYRNPVIPDGTLAVVISQSGETADSLAALQEVKLKGATTMGIVNVVGSSIARETDMGTYLRAGPEIGVASTKAFTAQLAILALIGIELGRRRHLSSERAAEVLAALERLPDQVAEALDTEAAVRDVAERLAAHDNWLYLGRGVNYPVALEGALKLKEVSYIHAEGLPAAEIKHGPIAMVDPGMPVVVIATQDNTYEKVLTNIQEVRAREGHVVAIASEGDEEIASQVDDVIYVPRTLPLLSPVVTTIPLQLLAYHAALLRGHDVDKPRNLAKSVTVE